MNKKSNLTTLTFIFILCLTSASLLAVISQALKTKQEAAKRQYLISQILISARILDTKGYFLLNNQPAIFANSHLVFSKKGIRASRSDIQKLYELRVTPLLCNASGQTFTFEQLNMDYTTYFENYQAEGFSQLEYKLYYQISDNENPHQIYGLTFPVLAFGLWDAIAALISIQPNGNTILGFSCYEQKETPGLGGEISEPWWQQQFIGKQIFRTSDYTTSPIGIDVVKPAKMDSLNAQQKRSSIAAITGASITSEGIMRGLQSSLTPYRNLLIRTRESYEKTPSA